MIFVVDASFVVERLFTGAEAFLRGSGGSALNYAAPYLLDAEVGQVLRRYFLNGNLDERAVEDARRLYSSFRVTRYEHLPLMKRSLQLKKNLTYYDALYVSLAEALNGVLLTRDERLRSAIRPLSRVQTRNTLP